jgi:hypothetical protein
LKQPFSPSSSTRPLSASALSPSTSSYEAAKTSVPIIALDQHHPVSLRGNGDAQASNPGKYSNYNKVDSKPYHSAVAVQIPSPARKAPTGDRHRSDSTQISEKNVGYISSTHNNNKNITATTSSSTTTNNNYNNNNNYKNNLNTSSHANSSSRDFIINKVKVLDETKAHTANNSSILAVSLLTNGETVMPIVDKKIKKRAREPDLDSPFPPPSSSSSSSTTSSYPSYSSSNPSYYSSSSSSSVSSSNSIHKYTKH